MNWRLQFLLWFVNKFQILDKVDIKNIEKERKKSQQAAELGKWVFDNKVKIKSIKDEVIKNIPIRIYNNSNASPQKVIIYFHGGGFVFYNIDSHDYVCRRLCSMNDCVVISVDYRLAPEHSFPAAHVDAYTIIEYVAKNAKKLGIDATKIIVAGDSAGGNLAACAVHYFKNNPSINIAAQVLIYPWIDGKINSTSIEEYSSGYLLTKEGILWFQQQYTPKKEDQLKPEVSPIYHKDFSNLAPAFVLTAEYDPLKTEGKQYADKIKNAGNIVLYKDYKKLVHGFFNIPKLSQESMQAYFDIQAFLKKVL